MNIKQKYKTLCEQEKQIPIFNQDWWLDSVCGENNWNVCLVEKDDIILAALPYYLTKKSGFKIITSPPLTQSLGPWIRKSDAKYSKSISTENKLIEELYSQLPAYDYLHTHWHYSLTNWISLYWKGYNQTTRYTYVIENLLHTENFLRDFSSSYRNKINKSKKIVSVKTDLSIQEFYRINSLTFARQYLNVPYSLEFLINHDKILEQKENRKIFYAMDNTGNIHSALYLTWDKMSSYVHLVGEDPKFRNSGAGILLIEEAIKYTQQELGLDKFDFEGSMIKNVEKVRRGCGGRQKAYLSISKTNSKLLKCYQTFKSLTK